MSAIEDRSTRTPSSHGLLSLAQELLDCIFDLAYPRSEDSVWLDRRQWEDQEREKQRAYRTTHTARPFPSPKVVKFLVSKLFFINAARAWVGNQKIDSDTQPAFGYYRGFGGIVRAYIVDLRSSWYDFTSVGDLHRFFRLRVLVSRARCGH